MSNKIKRIALLSTHGYFDAVPVLGRTDTGGQVVYVLELAKALGRMGIKVDIYTRWFDECTMRRIKTGPIIHLLTEPVTLRDTDRYYGFRRGRARGYLVAGLKLYVEMFKPRAGGR